MVKHSYLEKMAGQTVKLTLGHETFLHTEKGVKKIPYTTQRVVKVKRDKYGTVHAHDKYSGKKIDLFGTHIKTISKEW